MSASDNGSFVFPPPATVAIPVIGCEEAFPVRRIFCVGRNYAEHAREMGADPQREPPFFFTKPADAVVVGDVDVPYPGATANLHHEVELVIAIGRRGGNITPEDALDYVFGYAVGNDLTRRDLQGEAKKAGRPWDTAKGFDHSAPVSRITPATHCGHIHEGEISLRVNGDVRQRGDLRDMIWSTPEIISTLSKLFLLQPGDLIFSGTPAGVGPLQPGDEVDATIAGLDPLRHGVSAVRAPA